MINKVCFGYANASLRKSVVPSIKAVMMIVPIMAIVGLFMTALLIPYVNELKFLKNSGQDLIVYDDKRIALDNSFALLLRCRIGEVQQIDDVNWWKTSDKIDLYIMDEDKIDIEETYFTKQNIIQGSRQDLISDDRLMIGLTKQTALKLNSNIGDEISMQIETLDGKYHLYHVTVGAILKPKYTDVEGANGGVGVVLGGNRFKSLTGLTEADVAYKYGAFAEYGGLPEGHNYTKIVDRQSEYQKYSGFNHDYRTVLIVGGIVPLMGVILIFLLIRRETEYYIVVRKRDFDTLIALGASARDIVTIFIIEQLYKIVGASLIAGAVYKWILMEKFQKEYVDFSSVMIMTIVFLFISMIATALNLRKLSIGIAAASVAEMLVTREV